MLTGIGTVLLSLTLGVTAIALGGNLPISDHPMSSLSVAMVGVAALFTLCSGIIMMGGPTYAKVDRLDLFVAVRARRGMVVLWVSSIVLGALAYLNLTFIAGAARYEGEPVTVPILSYTLFPVALIVLSGVDVFVGRWLFRPSEKLLYRYSSQHGNRPR